MISSHLTIPFPAYHPVTRPLLAHYRRLAAYWQAEAQAQAERAARLQASLARALEMLERIDAQQHVDG